MMSLHPQAHGRAATGEEGQAAISVVLMLALFLLAVLGFAVDITNLWFHKQAARSAADAACQAGAMDMLAGQSGMSTSNNFTVGQSGDCSTTPGATICYYASANGYNGAGLTSGAASNSVSWTFPTSVSGVTGAGSYPFLKVSILENVRTYVMSLLTLSGYQTLNMSCTCGIMQVKAAAPMVVLNPTISGAFTYSGGGGIQIAGGPSRSFQVNSSSPTAVNWSASGMINLSAGGPNGTGSDVGIVGGPTSIPGSGTCNSNSGFCGGTTGAWKSGVLAVGDPYTSVGVPNSVKSVTPSLPLGGLKVAYGVDGCPDSKYGCYEYSPGYYPSGLSLANGYMTMIFQPGIYYLNGSLNSGNSVTLRMAKPAGYQQTDGIMFYFLSGSMNVSGCSGCTNSNIDNVPTTALTCDGSAPPASLNMPSSIGGNVLWGQCATNGTYWDTGGDTTDSRGAPGSRGLLVFQDHSNTATTTFTGSGQLSFSGALYMHSTSYGSIFNLSGGTSTGTFILGEVIADQVNLSGSGMIKLALNPAATTNVAKAAILQ